MNKEKLKEEIRIEIDIIVFLLLCKNFSGKGMAVPRFNLLKSL
jgi:hypothetical protein